MLVKIDKVVMLPLKEKEPLKKISKISIKLLIFKLPSLHGEDIKLQIKQPPTKLARRKSSRN
jgi:hypothetical protein